MLKHAIAAVVMAWLVTDVNGTWSADAETRFPSGKIKNHPLVFVFKQSDTLLTGSLGPDATHQFPIDRGRVAHDSLMFDCKWGNGALLHFRLAAHGSEITGIAEGDRSQLPADPGPNFTNTIYLTLKRE
jgi:hypothetical protein